MLISRISVLFIYYYLIESITNLNIYKIVYINMSDKLVQGDKWW